MKVSILPLSALLFQGLLGCSSDSPSSNDDQSPPTNRAALMTWLDSGAYNQWHCESAVHEARVPSPHGFNRICSNDAIAKNVAGTAPWPKGAAAVKELYTSLTDTTPGGYAVYLKTATDSANGANFYWYEIVPPESSFAAMFPPDGVVADGMGDSGNAKTVCVSCHMAAGSDALHTPSVGGRDEVYTPVP